MKLNKLLKTIIILVILGAALWFGLRWFGGLANDELGDYDGGRGEYVDSIENS
ncbi:hypothetical protein [Ruminococcus flavefaciens]|uniref:Uncharacterized protein n=1 Tax=Ruminococcus flavefaciens 007c TaxID=1341157 RepID=W7UVR9_RUMFL|nr:hypothetical protein [Ruminococcus flavefaciens]EWM52955.1 hypothetical protein RF007C_15185 [Ruminococcus flavefaciens 007c]